jgi:hypothetical protein
MRISFDLWFEEIEDCSESEIRDVLDIALESINATIENLKVED